MIGRVPSRLLIIPISILAMIAAIRPAILRGNSEPADSKEASLRALSLARNLSQTPISFEANVGQADSSAQFLARNKKYTLFLTPSEVVFSLRGAAGSGEPLSRTSTIDLVRMKFVNANQNARIAGQEKSSAISNYFIGNDPHKWHTGVPTYRTVRENGLYDGIDLLYYGNNNELEHDLIVAPGKNPNVIALSFPGSTSLKTDKNGDLLISLPDGELRLKKPRIRQQIAGASVEVAGGYKLQNAHQVGFQIGRYDKRQPLVIDPVIEFSTYLGGSSDDGAASVAVDSTGNIYVVGGTDSTNFPLQNPVDNSPDQTLCGTAPNAEPCAIGFLTKFDPTGSTLIYSTYFGGTTAGGSGIDSVVVDSNENVYIAGITLTTDLPTTQGAFQTTFVATNCTGTTTLATCREAFIAKFNPSGSALIYSTYLGAFGDSYLSAPRSLAVDAMGRAFVTGTTTSTSFPTTTGAFQPACIVTTYGCLKAFVAVLNPAGSGLVYATYLGGSAYDYGGAIAIDSSDSAIVTGTTSSTDFPLENPMQTSAANAFFTKFTPDGSGLMYSSYFGPNQGNQVNPSSMALDANGNIYLAGFTNSNIFPTTPGAFQTSPPFLAGIYGFATKIDESGGSVLYSTYFGGVSSAPTGLNPDTTVFDIAVDSLGQAYVTGSSDQLSLPQVNPALPNFAGGPCPVPSTSPCEHAFVAEFNAQGSGLLFSTYLGGSGADAGTAVAVDSSHAIYVVGSTNSSDFPVVNAFQPAPGGGTCPNEPACSDAFVAKLQPSPLTALPTSLTFQPQVVNSSSASQAVTVTNSTGQLIPVASVVASANFSETDNCSTGVPAASTCVVNVSFSPIASGQLTGTLTITYTGTGGTIVVPLSGVGNQADAVLSTGSLQFSSPFGQTSSPQAVTLTNQSASQLSISSITASGDFAETNNCGSSLALAASCSLSVTFAPQTTGALAGTLSISDTATGSPQQVTLSGTGTGPFVALSTSSLQFNPLAVGISSSAQNIVLTNSGTTALNISGIALFGDFSQTNNCGSNVAAGTSCVVSVIFTPQTVGTRTAQLLVVDNTFNSPQEVSLSGVGTGIVVSLAPSSLQFNSQIVGTTSASLAVTLTNSGTGIVNISQITASGDFAQTNNCGATLAAASNCSISVTFTPTTSGSRTGSLSIADNASGSPQSVSLGGTGTNFSLAAGTGSTTSATVTAGQTATFQLNLSPQGFSGAVTLACAPVTAIADGTCSVSPTAVTLSGTAPTTVTISVATVARTGALSPSPTGPFSNPAPNELKAMWWLSTMLLMLALVASFRRFRRMPYALSMALLLVLLVAGCGSGGGNSTGSSTGGSTTGSTGTPAGMYQLQVTATAGGVTRSMTLSLTVQ